MDGDSGHLAVLHRLHREVAAAHAAVATGHCTLGFFWDAGSHGLAGGTVRGFSLIPAGAVAAAQAEPAAGQTLHLPLIARP